MSSFACTRRKKIRIAVDVLIVISVFVIYGVVAARVRPTKRGFFCDDQSLGYPFRRDTVTVGQLLGTLFLVIPISIILTEILWAIYRLRSVVNNKRSIQKQDDVDDVPINGGEHAENSNVANGHVGTRPSTARLCCGRGSWSAASIAGFYLFGLMVTALITEIGKLTIGRHRPHFFDICRPDFSKLNCTQGYIEEYTCTSGAHPYRLMDSRKSFPSGHTSMAVYAAAFFAYYYRQRLVTDRSLLLKLIVDTCLCSLAVFTGLSRIIDNMHHWSDVFAGSVVGLAVAVWMVRYMRTTVTWDFLQPAATKQDQQDAAITVCNNKPCQFHCVDETNNGKTSSTRIQ